MADYAISNVPRRVVYANSGVGPYAFTFEILSQTDISVYRGSTLLTLTTDYSVTINTNGTGSITLVTAGTGNITIVGAKNIQRTTDFTTGGDLFANTLNDELDNQTIFIQQVAETAERGLKAPVTDPTDIAMTLPAKDGRKGKVLAFDSTTGNPVAGPALDSVVTVIEQADNINTVADNIADVVIVADDIADVNTVAGVAGNVTTVATNIANVNAVGSDLLEPTSEINTVATDIANVNTVGTNISNVNTVAGISSNVTTVAGISSNVTTVAGIAANVTTVAGVSASVTTVAGISADVTAVAADATDIGAVAGSISNVNTVATNIAAVNTNATNIVAIQNASTNATNAANSATAAASSASTASSAADAALAALDSFDDRYLGQKTSDPALDNDGNALVAGALYFNTTDDVMKVYEGSVWVAAYASLSGALLVANNLIDLASASAARTNLGLGTIATQNANNVNLTGGSISGITDLAVADGGTGSSTASGARTNLGLAIGTDVQAYSAALASYATNGVAMRNRIINGAMVIDQRNAGASVTPSAGDIYTIDRWQTSANVSGKISVQQVTTAPVGFANSAKITSTSAYTIGASEIVLFKQPIEGYNIADLNWGTANAKTITISFWVQSSLTGTFGGALNNNGSSRNYPFSYTISSENTWEQKSITIAGDTTGTWLTTNGIGLTLILSMGCGSSFSGTAGSWSSTFYASSTGATSVVGTNGATFYITGVQLEVGSSATGYEYRNYQQELAMCQRYLPAFTGANGATVGSIGTGGFYSTTSCAIGIPFPVTARVAPTGITVASASYFNIDGLTSSDCSSATFSNASQTMGGVNFGYNTTTTPGSFGRLRFNNASGTLLFTGCEL